MKPMTFPEVNGLRGEPKGWNPELGPCKGLPIFTNGEVCTSKWRMSWRERLHCLLRGYIWVLVVSGSTQPAIAVKAERTAFEPDGATGHLEDKEGTE